MKALFLGAGASYEAGMPLVWELTNILRTAVLTRLDTRLFDFRADPSFRSRFEAILTDPAIHYEQMVGQLQDIQLGRGPQSNIAHTTLGQLVDCVQILLLEDQMHTTGMLTRKVLDYAGLATMVKKHGCLHVFSLNHDINFEEICKHHNVPYRDGFYDGGGERYSNIARFKTLTRHQIDAGDFNYFSTTEEGVNLFKLHGSLDIFAVEDKNLYLKCIGGESERVGGHFQAIRQVETHSNQVCAQMQSRTVQELNVHDVNGELQFLRRSILSGQHKFTGRFEQIAPFALLDQFKQRMGMITELDVIGYGFGDLHVNAILSQWLHGSHTSLTIFDPHRKAVPDELQANHQRVKIVNGGFTSCLEQYGGMTHTSLSGLQRWILEKHREDLRQRRLTAWKPT